MRETKMNFYIYLHKDLWGMILELRKQEDAEGVAQVIGIAADKLEELNFPIRALNTRWLYGRISLSPPPCRTLSHLKDLAEELIVGKSSLSRVRAAGKRWNASGVKEERNNSPRPICNVCGANLSTTDHPLIKLECLRCKYASPDVETA